MLHGGGLEKASPARTIETHSPPGIEKTLNNMLREITYWKTKPRKHIFHVDKQKGRSGEGSNGRFFAF